MRRFTVYGEPVGKGRPKFSTVNGFPKAYTPAKTVSFENLVKISYQQQCNKVPYHQGEELEAEITAYFTIPKSASNVKRNAMANGKINPTKKPDCDNIAKAVLDALNGIAYHDDSQIVTLTVRKYYSETPRTEILIRRLGE